MKKSEAIKKLAEFLDKSRPDEMKAKAILEFVEDKLEMTAPLIATGVTGWEVGKGFSSYINKWEPEDE